MHDCKHFTSVIDTTKTPKQQAIKIPERFGQTNISRIANFATLALSLTICREISVMLMYFNTVSGLNSQATLVFKNDRNGWVLYVSLPSVPSLSAREVCKMQININRVTLFILKLVTYVIRGFFNTVSLINRHAKIESSMNVSSCSYKSFKW